MHAMRVGGDRKASYTANAVAPVCPMVRERMGRATSVTASQTVHQHVHKHCVNRSCALALHLSLMSIRKITIGYGFTTNMAGRFAIVESPNLAVNTRLVNTMMHGLAFTACTKWSGSTLVVERRKRFVRNGIHFTLC